MVCSITAQRSPRLMDREQNLSISRLPLRNVGAEKAFPHLSKNRSRCSSTNESTSNTEPSKHVLALKSEVDEACMHHNVIGYNPLPGTMSRN